MFICGQILCGFLFIACPLPVIVRRICIFENFEKLSLCYLDSWEIYWKGGWGVVACMYFYLYVYSGTLLLCSWQGPLWRPWYKWSILWWNTPRIYANVNKPHNQITVDVVTCYSEFAVVLLEFISLCGIAYGLCACVYIYMYMCVCVCVCVCTYVHVYIHIQ